MADELTTVRQNAALAALAADDDAYASFLARMDDKKKQRVTNSLNSLKHGLHAVAPITCQGPRRCPFVNHCPIPSVEQKQSKSYGPDQDYPMMMPCVLETMYQRTRIAAYLQHLDVDPANPVELALVNELAVLDLHKNRALMIMSEGDRDGDGRDFLRQDQDWSEVADEAKMIKRTQLHPVFEVLDKLERRRERLLERLLETRKARAEIDLKRGHIREDSNVLKEIQRVRQFLEQASSTSIDGDEPLLLDD